ncbi:MAG: hypothetical protein FWG88_09290 [Oscillospiraceae bacterium]|nr:hypothetical protein [Oscillospiraceae bacterium]
MKVSQEVKDRVRAREEFLKNAKPTDLIRLESNNNKKATKTKPKTKHS